MASRKGMNENQRRIADHIDHPLLVDAGPGTGKTSTVVERYVRILESGADPRKVLMVTFTNNAAAEMRERIRAKMTAKISEYNDALRVEEEKPRKDRDWDLIDSLEEGRKLYKDALNEVRASTFDSLCLRVVLDAPEFVSEFFGFKDITLTRNAKLVQNETLNKDYFRRFYASFISKYAHLYVKEDAEGNIIDDLPSMLSSSVDDLYNVINKLMSTGIIPVADGDWFADGEQRIFGDRTRMIQLMKIANDREEVYAKIDSNIKDNCADGDPLFGDEIVAVKSEPKGSRRYSDELLEHAVDGGRSRLFYFINHLYYEYIRRSVSDNRLTFGLVSVFAFCILYTDQRTRNLYSMDYLIVDEFQDTNAMQMDICLMLSAKDNICVVGDWKQGIYGFRYASIDNITEFQSRMRASSRNMNSDGTKRVNVGRDVEVSVIPLNENYRSHGTILDWAFKALTLGVPEGSESGPEIIHLDPKRNVDYGENSGFGLCTAESLDEEYELIVNKISEYVGSGNYLIEDGGDFRQPRYGDIAVLFRNGEPCNAIYNRLREEGIPAFLQADQEIMSSLPGKLALAWLRFINDKDDRRGISTILVHEGYSLAQIKSMYSEVKDGRDILDAIPGYLAKERTFLSAKRKRPNDLLTSVFAFHRIGDDDEHSDAAQAIINAISSSFNTSLMTISDMIRLMEDDIEKGTTYPVDAILGRDAVTVQTMHKSKGLEYPIVIIGGVGKMPGTDKDRDKVRFDTVLGLRCTDVFVNRGDGCIGPIKDWRYNAIRACKERDDSEERRLLFVAMSRAKQYMFMTGKPKYTKAGPSGFMAHFVEEYKRIHGDVDPAPVCHQLPEEVIGATVIEPPVIPEYTTRRRGLDVHSLITYVPAEPGSSEREGGKEYGNAVHFIADKLVKKRRDDLDARVLAEAYAGDKGMDPEELCQDAVRINRFIDGTGDAMLISETPCSLPVSDTMIHGIIDLIVDRGDVIEVYDYKTESDHRNLEEYSVQVSIYAHSVMQARGTDRVKAFLYYVTRGDDPIEVDILPMSEVEARLERYKKETSEVPDADYR